MSYLKLEGTFGQDKKVPSEFVSPIDFNHIFQLVFSSFQTKNTYTLLALNLLEELKSKQIL